jgi:hypothetical protein
MTLAARSKARVLTPPTLRVQLLIPLSHGCLSTAFNVVIYCVLQFEDLRRPHFRQSSPPKRVHICRSNSQSEQARSPKL